MYTETGPQFPPTFAERRAKAEYVAARNTRINEAARLAETKIGGRVGEEIHNLLVVFYGTDSAKYVDDLARAIIAEHGRGQCPARSRPAGNAAGQCPSVSLRRKRRLCARSPTPTTAGTCQSRSAS